MVALNDSNGVRWCRVVCAGTIALLIAAMAGLSTNASAQTPEEKSAEDEAAAAEPLQETAEPAASSEQPAPKASSTSSISASPPEQGAVPLPELNMGEPVESTGRERPFWSDSTLKLHLRSFYFNRNKFDGSQSEAEAMGGWLTFKSGYLAERFAMGATVYTSQPIYAPDSHDGTNILQDDQEGYTALGQLYGEIRIFDSLQANLGRKEYNTPFINMHDVRMTPKTFTAGTLTGTHAGKKEGSQWRYGGGYVYSMKDWTDTDFDSMSDALGVDEDRGVYTAGANYSTPRYSIGAIDYYSSDVINIFYTEGSYGWKLSPNSSLKFSGQFIDQRSTGDDLIIGDSFDVQQYGVKSDVGIHAATFTFAYTDTTGGDESMRSPWGGYPGYTSVQVNDFNRAGEQALMGKFAYDFTHIGLKGFSVYALYVSGFDRDNDAADEDEWNLNVQWAPKEGRFKDFSARARYSHIERDEANDTSQDDFRLILNYDFAIR